MKRKRTPGWLSSQDVAEATGLALSSVRAYHARHGYGTARRGRLYWSVDDVAAIRRHLGRRGHRLVKKS